MKKTNWLFLLALVCVAFISSCKDEDDKEMNTTEETTKTLTLDFKGLQDVGSDYAYEGWIMVDGKPVSAGVFNVDAEGKMSTSSFDIKASALEKATAYILTIEPSPDTDPAPSDVHILAGDFSGNAATLTTKHSAALGTDFSDATGSYLLATPTDGSGNNELSGVWWLNSLKLPTLPKGWAYEGWAVIDGKPVTTGKFTDPNAKDYFDGYSGTVAKGPNSPGEDFIMNAPNGLTFPTNLSGKTLVISVEPSPDNSTAPFAMKPLVGNIPTDATDHKSYSMDNNAANTNPTGTATR